MFLSCYLSLILKHILILDLTWLRCSGLSVPLLSYGKSFSNQSYSGLDVLPLQGVVLRCSWSDLSISAGGVHVVLPLWNHKKIFVCLVWVSGVRHPGNMSKPSQLPFVDFLGNGLVDMKFSSDVNIHIQNGIKQKSRSNFRRGARLLHPRLDPPLFKTTFRLTQEEEEKKNQKKKKK